MPPPRKKRLTQSDSKIKPKVFLVHGQNEGVQQMVARYLEKLGCNVLILHELPNEGKTIFQKFHWCPIGMRVEG
jgi:predicted nucleotide-binding protein